MKLELLKELMKGMDERVVENDIMPKTKMVVKAEGDSPEEVKEEIISKLGEIDMPDEEEMEEEMIPEGMEEMEEEMDEESMEEEVSEEMEEEDDEDYLSEMPQRMREALAELKKKKM